MFEWFNFGKIKYDGKIYTYDVWVNEEGDILPRRSLGDHHFLTREELKQYLKNDSEMLIFGTGDYGIAKLTEDAQKLINSKKIKTIVKTTPEAIKEFNKLKKKGKKIIAVMHITC